MRRVVHIIGNGGSSFLYNEEKRKGLKLGCNQIGFNIPEKYASCIVDYKFMQAMTANEITLPGQWILGFRPKHWMEMNPDYYMKVSKQVKEFYTELPNYAANYTDFNCGHMAAHYSANKLKADEIHLYGFDSIFDFNLNSASDLSLKSDRGSANNLRLADNWRPIWQSMFKEFSDTKFILHYTHDKLKINIGNNVDVRIYNLREKEKNISFDQLSEA